MICASDIPITYVDPVSELLFDVPIPSRPEIVIYGLGDGHF